MAIPATSITVNDGAGTPVAQTFSIVDRTALTSVFRNMAASLVRGSQKFTHEVRLANSNGAANRVFSSLVTPVEGVIDGVTTVLRTSSFKLECNFSPDSTATERQTAYGLFINLLSQADVKAATTGLISLS